uniref:UDP-N-acetylglucosamine--dolichyl-phosphate N-acetylglucosaminephosphotransferase n=1 Tax=Trichogramma kaykai TaxID=54128 RepID=A0ABD2WV37_9HYME
MTENIESTLNIQSTSCNWRDEFFKEVSKGDHFKTELDVSTSRLLQMQLLNLQDQNMLMYPASVFVGDTFCYSSGMTFVVVGIIGHFSKTMLLFFMPQIFNFLYSVPQLFHLIPCPRHRLPKYDEKKNISKPSVIVFDKKELNRLARFIMSIFRCFRVVDWKESDDGIVVCNNLTLNNFVLIFFGPIREPSLTNIMLLIQTICSVFAFIIRYPLASIFYDT